MNEPTLHVRDLRFGMGDVPRHWLAGRRSVTTFLDNLSVFFPVGERFFVATVRAHEAHVTSDALRAAVNGFCGQEGVHGREHIRYNAMLRKQGYPVDAMEKRVARVLRIARSLLPARSQLAATCGLEHFTALMAQLILADPRVLEGAHPEMARLWRWHAAEENEHRAVAFDVFHAAGGTYLERSAVMVLATVIFWGKVIEQQARMMHADGTLWSAREWLDLLRFLFVEPGSMRGLFLPYLDYYRPGFHPHDIDCSALIAEWRRQYDERAAS